MPPLTAEVRTHCAPIHQAEVRAAEDGSSFAGTIVGYAAVYESVSEDLGGFREILRRGAFREVLAEEPDVRMPHVDHAGMPVARTRAGTLRLSEDTTGLRFEADMPNTERGREMVVAVQRGDLNNCSFRFTCGPEDRSWSFPDDELPLRAVHTVRELWDVCLVTYPAYGATSAGVRSAEADATVEVPPNPAVTGNHRLRLLALRDRA